MIEIKNIHKNFGKKEILKGINLNLKTGKVYGLLGNNGAGKTTLMRTVFNMIKPDEGEISYNGDPQKRINYREWFYFTETDSLPLKMTCSEYLQTLASLANVKKKEYKERLKDAIEIINPDFSLKSKIKKLSSGQQKLVSCMAVLIVRPKVIFLDEPTANMDVKNQSIVLDMVASLKNENRIIVIITHLIKEIKDSLTDVVILDDGIIKYDKQFKKTEDLDKIFRQYTTPIEQKLDRIGKQLND